MSQSLRLNNFIILTDFLLIFGTHFLSPFNNKFTKFYLFSFNSLVVIKEIKKTCQIISYLNFSRNFTNENFRAKKNYEMIVTASMIGQF